MTWISWMRRAMLAAALLFACGPANAAADPSATALAELIKPLLILPADSGGDWEGLESHPAIRWGGGPVMSSRASPDGNFFARAGQASVAGRTLAVVASGARSVVFSIYLRDPAPPMAPYELVAGSGRRASRSRPRAARSIRAAPRPAAGTAWGWRGRSRPSSWQARCSPAAQATPSTSPTCRR